MNNIFSGILVSLFTLFISQAYAAPATLSDPEVASVVETANTGEIKAGKYAQAHANSSEVKEFAQHMVTDHTEMNDSTKALAKKLSMNPQFNPVSKSLKDDNDKSMNQLQSLKGTDFDKAYLDDQVKLHKSVLDTIDSTLLPSARNQELKNSLTQARAKVAEHLEHAQKLQANPPR